MTFELRIARTPSASPGQTETSGEKQQLAGNFVNRIDCFSMKTVHERACVDWPSIEMSTRSFTSAMKLEETKCIFCVRVCVCVFDGAEVFLLWKPVRFLGATDLVKLYRNIFVI